jgi:uncharacterized protein (DUF952 family)
VTRIYKILNRREWIDALAKGRFEGSIQDRADGFIHFSTAGQVGETARRHFRGQSDLMVLAVEADSLGPALKWEPSRGGALFPHFYGALACKRVVEVRAVLPTVDGILDPGDLVP